MAKETFTGPVIALGGLAGGQNTAVPTAQYGGVNAGGPPANTPDEIGPSIFWAEVRRSPAMQRPASREPDGPWVDFVDLCCRPDQDGQRHPRRKRWRSECCWTGGGGRAVAAACDLCGWPLPRRPGDGGRRRRRPASRSTQRHRHRNLRHDWRPAPSRPRASKPRTHGDYPGRAVGLPLERRRQRRSAHGADPVDCRREPRLR